MMSKWTVSQQASGSRSSNQLPELKNSVLLGLDFSYLKNEKVGHLLYSMFFKATESFLRTKSYKERQYRENTGDKAFLVNMGGGRGGGAE